MKPFKCQNLTIKALQSSCKQARYGHPKTPLTFPILGNTCTDNLFTAATIVSYEQGDLYMLVTTKALLVTVTRAQVIINRL